MAVHNFGSDSAHEFAKAVKSVQEATLRPEMRTAEIPAPRRVAPHAFAISGEVVTAPHDTELAHGRLVLLYDPAGHDAWNGFFRVVTFMRSELDPEMARDPMLSDVAWTWLTEALSNQPSGYCALGGTVTTVVSESFGTLSDDEARIDIEIRASWTPLKSDIGPHTQAWGQVMCAIAGLPPLPEGVTSITRGLY